MGRPTWSAARVLAGIAVLGVACKDQGPGGPAALVAASGSGQSGPVGDPLPNYLKVTATGGDGSAFRNATITWEVITGSAQLSRATGTTDVNGQDSIRVTLGTVVGTVRVQASSGGATPVVFDLTAVDGCDWVTPITLPGSRMGSLRAFDCDLGDGSSVDFYGTTVPSQQWVTFGMTSDSLDTFVWLYAVTGPVIALSDDIVPAVNTNTALKALVPAGSYVIGANSFSAGEVGPYTVTTTQPAITVAGCGEYWVGWDVGLSDNVQATDCDDAAGTSYFDDLLLVLHDGQQVTVTMTAGSPLDPFLRLYQATSTGFNLVASDDNSAGDPSGTGARLIYTNAQTPPASAVYLIEAATAGVGQTGPYSLTVVATAPPLAAAARAPGAAPLRPYRPTVPRRAKP